MHPRNHNQVGEIWSLKDGSQKINSTPNLKINVLIKVYLLDDNLISLNHLDIK